MGLFGRKKPTSFFDRFPQERFSQLPTLLGLSLRQYADATEADPEKAWTCRFFLGYLLGYPSYVDQLDQASGAAVRQFLFTSLFGETDANSLHERAMGHAMLSDPQTTQGALQGELDGERFFKALEQHQRASEATLALKTGFDLGLIDVNQQT